MNRLFFVALIALAPFGQALASSPVTQPRGMTLMIPNIEVSTPMEMAQPNPDGTLDFSGMERGPVMVETRRLGENGVTLILGHRQWGPTPKVFAKLDRLRPGDRITIITDETELTYKVTSSFVVLPMFVWDELKKLDDYNVGNGSSGIVLDTCTPYGTDWFRLFVVAQLEDSHAYPAEGGRRNPGR